MQWTPGVSSNRFLQTLQNLRLWCVGSDQQCATGFLIKHGAIPEHGVITLVTHFSWTTKLQAERKEREKFSIFFFHWLNHVKSCKEKKKNSNKNDVFDAQIHFSSLPIVLLSSQCVLMNFSIWKILSWSMTSTRHAFSEIAPCALKTLLINT